MITLAIIFLALIAIGALGLIYSFLPFKVSRSFVGMFIAIGSSALALIGLIGLAALGVSEVFFTGP